MPQTYEILKDDLPKEDKRKVSIQSRANPGSVSKAPFAKSTPTEKKSTSLSSFDMKVLGGFISSLGIAAVATGFVALVIALAVPALVLVVIEAAQVAAVAAIAIAIGLFATSKIKKTGVSKDKNIEVCSEKRSYDKSLAPSPEKGKVELIFVPSRIGPETSSEDDTLETGYRTAGF